jgi:SAM-dependent methyltransferase
LQKPLRRRRPDGWFRIDGVQDGHVEFERQFRGLEIDRAQASGARVLDLGCAEGLISLEMAKAGAALVHGVELEAKRVETARSLFAAHPEVQSTFIAYDLNGFPELFLTQTADSEWKDTALLTRYDIVLCLAIAMKLARPAPFLRLASALCDRVFAVRLPFPVIDDPRSDNIPVDVKRLLADEFDLVQETELYPEDPKKPYVPGEYGWLGIFQRHAR